ncbi:MAG: carboxypeptidase-like regulatory domain-containing protein [Planctomycetota bacterium]
MSVKSTMPVLGVALVSLCLLFVWWMTDREAPEEPVSTPQQLDSADHDSLPAPLGVEKALPDRMVVSTERPLPPQRIVRLLHGTVTDSEQRNVARGEVVLSRPGVDTPQESVFSTKIEDGRYALAGLPSGAWHLTATAPGFHDVQGPIDLAEDEEVHRLDLTLRAAQSLRIHLTDREGELLWNTELPDQIAVCDLRLILTRELPGAEIADHEQWRSRRLGLIRFEPEAPPSPGYLDLYEPPPVFLSVTYGSLVLATTRIEQGAGNIVLHVPVERVRDWAGSVSLRLVGDLAESVVSTGVRVRQGNFRRDASGRDLTGLVQVAPVDPIPGILTISLKGYPPWSRVVSLRPREELNLGEVSIDPFSVEVIVTDVRGEPVACRVGCEPLEFSYGPLAPDFGQQVATDTSGKARVVGLVRGPYLIFTRPPRGVRARNAPWDRAPRVIDTTQSSGGPVELVLRPVTAVTLDYRGDPTRRPFAVIKDEANVPWWKGEVDPGTTICLEQGAYTVTVAGSPEMNVSVPFGVESHPLRVTIPPLLDEKDLPPMWRFDALDASLAGVSTLAVGGIDRLGTTLYGAISSLGSDPEPAMSITMEQEGGKLRYLEPPFRRFYAVPGLGPGRTVLRAYALGCSMFEARVELDSSAPSRRLDITMEASIPLSVRLITLDGRPLLSALRELHGKRRFGLKVIGSREPLAHGTDVKGFTEAGLYRGGESSEGTLEVWRPLPVYASLINGERVLATQIVTDCTEQVTFTVAVNEVTLPTRAPGAR